MKEGELLNTHPELKLIPAPNKGISKLVARLQELQNRNLDEGDESLRQDLDRKLNELRSKLSTFPSECQDAF